MKEIKDVVKDVYIPRYAKEYPMYYDLVVYVMKLEKRIKELEGEKK